MRIPRPLRWVRAGLLGALQCALVVSLHAATDGRDPAVGVANRYVVMHIGDQPTVPGPPTTFLLDHPQRRVSYRFTALEAGRIRAVHVFASVVGTPGAVRVGVALDDGSGRPGPPLAVGAWPPTAGTRRWHRVPLSTLVTVQRGDVVHLTFTPASGSGPFDAQNLVELIPARSRFPVPYQPAPGSDSSTRCPVSPHDGALTVLFDRSDGQGWIELRHAFTTFVPIFAVETADGRYLGQPFDTHIEATVGGEVLYGQQVTPDTDVAFDYVAMFVRQAEVQKPQQNLLLRVYEVAAGGGTSLLAQTNLAIHQNPLYHLRSHWFGAYLGSGMRLAAGHTYVFALAKPGGGPGYTFSAEHSTLPVQAGIEPADVPSFLGESSFAVVSQDGGATFHPLRAPSDAALVLARFGSARAPIGQLDEVEAYAFDDGDPQTPWPTYPYLACPGDRIGLSVVARNIGLGTPPYAQHSLFSLVRDRETGAVLAVVDHGYVPPNQESPRCLELTMPNVALWRLSVEVGHYEAGGGLVTDDSARLDIRRPQGACPGYLDFKDCSQL